MVPVRTDLDLRVLMLSPLRRDVALSTDLLAWAGFHCEGFTDADALVNALAEGGAGMLLIASEALSDPAFADRLTRLLDDQPAWSDLPISVITHARVVDPHELHALRGLERMHSVTFLDRPVRIAALVSTVRSALQARNRQYQVRALLAAAEDDVRRRDEFLAMLSHELRNPLSAASNVIQVLRLQPERVPAATSILERQIEHLTRMVDDLLDVARITSGKVELQKSRVDLNRILDEGVDTVAAFVGQRGHRLEVMHAPQPVFVEADRARLVQVIGNLLHNAAKYTEPGGWIRAELRAEAGVAVLGIKDSGVGLDEAQLDSIFELFAQGRQGIDRSQGGLGVGLTIVRRLVRMHGGEVYADSEGPGRGSEFRVRLPIAERRFEVDDIDSPYAGPEHSCRVLVIDDNREVAEGLVLLAQALGHEVRAAYNGPDGFVSAQEFHPDVVFLDLGMPGMDGFEVSRALKTLPHRSRMTVVATTGYGDRETVARSRSAGFDRHLLKPARVQALQEIFAEAGRSRAD